MLKIFTKICCYIQILAKVGHFSMITYVCFFKRLVRNSLNVCRSKQKLQRKTHRHTIYDLQTVFHHNLAVFEIIKPTRENAPFLLCYAYIF